MEVKNSIYGNHCPEMKAVMRSLVDCIHTAAGSIRAETGTNPVEHLKCRIKAEDSMREKCRRNNLPETTESALNVLTDSIGIRIVCAFLSDVYRVAEYLKSFPDLTVVTEKDYIRNVKPNGYRSYHMILRTERGYFVEIQLRTISMDTWAALEHHLKYKKSVGGNVELVKAELKRCANELAATDVSMQAIRELIFEQKE